LFNPEPFFEALVGKVANHVWNGHGSAIFIEFGALTERTKRDGSIGNPDGELTLMIEWSWRIEKKHSILGGSWSSERRWPGFFKSIQGASVTAVEIFGHIPEILVSLSNGLRVVSFMTAEGQPEWALLTRNPFIGHLSVERGRLKIDERHS
jgi:hypothetical protein